MPDPAFARILNELHDLDWPSTESIRRRARQRTRRQAVAAGLVTLAAALVLSGAIAATALRATPPGPIAPSPGGTEPSVTPSGTQASTTPSGSASPTASQQVPPDAIPEAAMLRTEDLRPGFVAAGEDIDGDWTFQFLASTCDQYAVYGPAADLTRGARFVLGDIGPQSTPLLERVEYRSEMAATRFLSYVVEQVGLCAQGTYASMAVVLDGFAGDESLVIRTAGDGFETLTIIVRVGGLVAEVWQQGLTDVDEAQRLGARAAQRLSEASTPA